MAYRIMTVEAEKQNNNSTYRYLKVTDTSGSQVVYETDDVAELKVKVEEMLNGTYAKKDFIVVQPFDYELATDINTTVTPDDPEGGNSGGTDPNNGNGDPTP